jgi:hypothetical protein
MYLLIRYPIGIIVEAVVLAEGKNRMRLAASGFPDAVELTRSGYQWYAANNQPVEIDFMMSTDKQGASAPSPQTRAAKVSAAAATRQ